MRWRRQNKSCFRRNNMKLGELGLMISPLWIWPPKVSKANTEEQQFLHNADKYPAAHVQFYASCSDPIAELVWSRRLDRALLRSLPTQITLWSHDPGRTKGTWLPGNLSGQHPALKGNYWGKIGISSGKAVTAEAQGLCREASLSLRCPAALPPRNNNPQRNSYREFPLSSVLLCNQQLDPSLLFSLNIMLNHMPPSSQHSASSSFIQFWGKMLFIHLSPVCQVKCQCEQTPAHFRWNKPSHF